MAEKQTKEQHAPSCCGDHSSHTHLGCCSEGEEVCETCGGTGEVSVMEHVYAGEPHMADIGTARCPDCNLPDEDEYDPD